MKKNIEYFDALIGIHANSMVELYTWGDPCVTLKLVQEALIAAQKYSKEFDQRYQKYNLGHSSMGFAVKRLRAFGIDPETLEIIEEASVVEDRIRSRSSE